MAKKIDAELNKSLEKKTADFMNRLDSDMHYRSHLKSDSMSFDWLDLVEYACPYIDNIVREPKLALIKEEDVVPIEKAKTVSVESVKNLTTHTNYIEKIDPETGDIQPNKLLITRSEETFNTYENRFVYTLIYHLSHFLYEKEVMLDDFEAENDEILEYKASTYTGGEKISIQMKVGSKEMPEGESGGDFKNEVEDIRERVREVRKFVTRWENSDFVKGLKKARAIMVKNPIKKTNIILMNPNFQNIMELWGYLLSFSQDGEESDKEALDTSGTDRLRSILDDSFLLDYYVLDSISKSKREQKKKVDNYAMIMFKRQIQRAISLLLSSGIDISEEEMIKLISENIQEAKKEKTIDNTDIKKKFKNEMNEYLERMQDYL